MIMSEIQQTTTPAIGLVGSQPWIKGNYVTLTWRILILTIATLWLGCAATADDTCNDERDTIVKEYTDLGVDFQPTCGDFTQDAHSANFSFAELNSGDFSWAILRATLLTGIEKTRSNNGDSALTVNSGYRNPKHNATIPGSAPNSRHVHGDAVDFQSSADTWDSLRKAGKDAGACSEPQDLSGTGHVHLDWRGTCPAGW